MGQRPELLEKRIRRNPMKNNYGRTVRMDEYTVYEYPCMGAYSYSRVIYAMLKDTFGMKDRKTGYIIVFPEEVTDVASLPVSVEYHMEHLLRWTHIERDGSIFSKRSICLDILEYSCDCALTLAQTYLSLYGCSTIMLKDFEKKRLLAIHRDEKVLPKNR